jgi:N-acetylmuramoyl-L-alanine amidase
MPAYTVSAGESLASIAKDNGYLWKTIWDDGKNAALKAKRPNPNQLVEGDELWLPEKGAKTVSKPVDAKHTFKRKGEPTRLKLQLLSMGDPRKNEKYTLTFGDQVVHGTTDDQGKIDQPIPGEVKTATLMLGSGAERYEVAVGGLDPIEEISGVQHRLSNLGFSVGGERGEVGDATRQALLAFQRAQGLTESGEIDAATRAKLGDLHA